MFCTQCGQRNPANARFCCACGAAMHAAPRAVAHGPAYTYLVRWPATLMTWYFALIRGFYGLVVLIIWPILLISLVLWFGFGVRWGW